MVVASAVTWAATFLPLTTLLYSFPCVQAPTVTRVFRTQTQTLFGQQTFTYQFVVFMATKSETAWSQIATAFLVQTDPQVYGHTSFEYLTRMIWLDNCHFPIFISCLLLTTLLRLSFPELPGPYILGHIKRDWWKGRSVFAHGFQTWTKFPSFFPTRAGATGQI